MYLCMILKLLVGDRRPGALLDVAGGQLDQQRCLGELSFRFHPAAISLAIGGKCGPVAFADDAANEELLGEAFPFGLGARVEVSRAGGRLRSGVGGAAAVVIATLDDPQLRRLRLASAHHGLPVERRCARLLARFTCSRIRCSSLEQASQEKASKQRDQREGGRNQGRLRQAGMEAEQRQDDLLGGNRHDEADHHIGQRLHEGGSTALARPGCSWLWLQDGEPRGGDVREAGAISLQDDGIAGGFLPALDDDIAVAAIEFDHGSPPAGRSASSRLIAKSSRY